MPQNLDHFAVLELIKETGKASVDELADRVLEEGMVPQEMRDKALRAAVKKGIRDACQIENPDTGLPYAHSIVDDEGKREYIHSQSFLFNVDDYYKKRIRTSYYDQTVAMAQRVILCEQAYGLEQISLDLEYLREAGEEEASG